MDHFPLEIWQQIGRDACLDGGYTGCSLSSASHAMRDAVRAVRHTSVAVTNLKSCVAYTTLIHDSGQLPIRHLFITIPITSGVSTAISEEQQIICKAVIDILAKAAHTVITLTIHAPVSFNLIGAGLRFPVLLDLSVPDLALHKQQEPVANMLPALERLHISKSSDYTQSIGFWELIARLTPHLTSIRLSSVSRWWLPPFLRILLNAPADPTQRREYLFRVTEEFPPTYKDVPRMHQVASQLDRLVHVVVQPGKCPTGGRCATGSIEHLNTVAALEYIVAETRLRAAGEPGLWLLPDSKDYELGLALDDWLDVVLHGGDGPWHLPE